MTPFLNSFFARAVITVFRFRPFSPVYGDVTRRFLSNDGQLYWEKGYQIISPVGFFEVLRHFKAREMDDIKSSNRYALALRRAIVASLAMVLQTLMHVICALINESVRIFRPEIFISTFVKRLYKWRLKKQNNKKKPKHNWFGGQMRNKNGCRRKLIDFIIVVLTKTEITKSGLKPSICFG